MDKRAKVVMLPTNKKAGLVINPSTEIIQYIDFNKDAKYYTDASFICNHLYITSDDEIKEDDWVYHKSGYISKVLGFNLDAIKLEDAQRWTKDCKKVIATTDSSLSSTCNCGHIKTVNTGLCMGCAKFSIIPLISQPSQSFIQKYVEEYNKGNQIVDVLVEYDENIIATQTEPILQHQGSKPKIVPHKVEHKLKVSKDNTITIRKIKDSWSRDEVVELIYNFAYDLTEKRKTAPLYQRYDKWIEENL